MKPKLWNGASPEGEGKLRNLEQTLPDMPYASASGLDFRVRKAGAFTEVFKSDSKEESAKTKEEDFDISYPNFVTAGFFNGDELHFTNVNMQRRGKQTDLFFTDISLGIPVRTNFPVPWHVGDGFVYFLLHLNTDEEQDPLGEWVAFPHLDYAKSWTKVKMMSSLDTSKKRYGRHYYYVDYAGVGQPQYGAYTVLLNNRIGPLILGWNHTTPAKRFMFGQSYVIPQAGEGEAVLFIGDTASQQMVRKTLPKYGTGWLSFYSNIYVTAPGRLQCTVLGAKLDTHGDPGEGDPPWAGKHTMGAPKILTSTDFGETWSVGEPQTTITEAMSWHTLDGMDEFPYDQTVIEALHEAYIETMITGLEKRFCAVDIGNGTSPDYGSALAILPDDSLAGVGYYEGARPRKVATLAVDGTVTLLSDLPGMGAVERFLHTDYDQLQSEYPGALGRKENLHLNNTLYRNVFGAGKFYIPVAIETETEYIHKLALTQDGGATWTLKDSSHLNADSMTFKPFVEGETSLGDTRVWFFQKQNGQITINECDGNLDLVKSQPFTIKNMSVTPDDDVVISHNFTSWTYVRDRQQNFVVHPGLPARYDKPLEAV